MVVIIFCATIVSGLLFAYTVISDGSHLAHTVYPQLAASISEMEWHMQQPRLAPTIGDIGVMGLIGLLAAGLYFEALRRFQSRIDRAVLSLFFSLAIIGFLALVLSLMGALYQQNVLAIVGLACVGLVLAAIRRKPFAGKLLQARELLSLRKPRAETLLITGIVSVTFGLTAIYALILPIIDFDSLIYHAEIAKILYFDHSYPVLGGPSIGIEISANYPPLFSAIGAGLYAMFGRFDDSFLRILPPLFGLVIVWGTARISNFVFAGSARYAVLVLVSTPLFVHSILIPSTTTLYTAGIVCSILGVLYACRTQSQSGPTQPMDRIIYAIMSGIAMGISLLASYQALFYAPIPILAMVALLLRRREKHDIRPSIAMLLVIFVSFVLLTSSLWYARNVAVHGNPFYPWLLEQENDSQFELLHDTTKRDIQTVGSYVTFGQFDYELLDARNLFRDHPVLFPAFSIVSLIGLIALVYLSRRNIWLALWAAIPLAVILVLGTIFPRYLVPLVAGFSISFAVLVALALRSIKEHVSTSKLRTLVKPSVIAVMVAMYILVGLPVAIANPAINMGNYPDRLYFLTHTGDPDDPLRAFYRGDVDAWKWISKNASEEKRVATFDPRIYYMGHHGSVFALDGQDSLPLYQLKGTAEIKRYLVEHDVSYIFDSETARASLSKKLPLSKFLGSEDFPEIISFGNAKIYAVAK